MRDKGNNSVAPNFEKSSDGHGKRSSPTPLPPLALLELPALVAPEITPFT